MSNVNRNINSISQSTSTGIMNGNGHSSNSGNNNNNNNHQLHHQQQLKQKKIIKQRTRDSHCCSINFIKYVLHIFNIIFFMSGIAVALVAIWTIFWKHEYISLFDSSTYLHASYGLLVAGILAFSAAIWGCCGIWREQRSMLCCYSFLLVTVFALEFLVGGIAYIYETQIDDELLHTMNKTFVNNYGIDETRTVAIDSMQQNYRCCGAIRFEEWRDSIWLNATEESDLIRSNVDRVVPDSCCISYREKCGKSDHPSNIPYTGCIYKFIDETRDHLNIIAAVGSGLCFIQLFGLILSCCLFFKLKDIDD